MWKPWCVWLTSILQLCIQQPVTTCLKFQVCALHRKKNMAAPATIIPHLIGIHRRQAFWFNQTHQLVVNNPQTKLSINLGEVQSLVFVAHGQVALRGTQCYGFWAVTTPKGVFAVKPKHWLVRHPNSEATLGVLLQWKAEGPRRSSKDAPFAGKIVISHTVCIISHT